MMEQKTIFGVKTWRWWQQVLDEKGCDGGQKRICHISRRKGLLSREKGPCPRFFTLFVAFMTVFPSGAARTIIVFRVEVFLLVYPDFMLARCCPHPKTPH